MYPPHICLSLAKACHDETSMPHSSLLSANPALLKQQHMTNVESRPFHEVSKESGWNEKAKDILFFLIKVFMENLIDIIPQRLT